MWSVGVAVRRRQDVVELGAFARVQRKFQLALGVQLGAGIFRLTEMLDRSLGPASRATAQAGQLLEQAGALRQQQCFERGSEFLAHGRYLVG